MSRIFESIFRGGKSSVKFPKVEPAQNFRCGINILQERAVIFSFFVAAFCVFWGFSFAIVLRVFSVVYYTKVDYSMIDSMAITCSGCKIQVTNNANWAGLFSPSNLLMYLVQCSQRPPFPTEFQLATTAFPVSAANQPGLVLSFSATLKGNYQVQGRQPCSAAPVLRLHARQL